MGNQACQPNQGHTYHESVRSKSFIGSDHYKNKQIYKDEGPSHFPELPTLGDEHSTVKMSNVQEIKNTRIKASAAKKKKQSMNQSYSVRDLDHENRLDFAYKTNRNQHNNNQSFNSSRNVSQTYRNDQTVYQKKRHHSSFSLSESASQTNRKHNIFSFSPQEEKDVSKISYKKSESFKESFEEPHDNFQNYKEEYYKNFAEAQAREAYGHKRNFSCTLENDPNVHREYKSGLNTTDPIQSYLKRFTASNNADHGHSEEYIQINPSPVSLNYRDPKQENSLIYTDKRAVQNSGQPQYEIYNRHQYNLTFEYSGSSKGTLTSESTLFSEPEINEASQLNFEAKRLCNYDLVNGVMKLESRPQLAYGSRNFSSITEFDHENYGKLHVIEERPSLNGGLVSSRKLDNTSRKTNSTQDSLHIIGSKPYIVAEGRGNSVSSLGKIQSLQSIERSDYSAASSLNIIQVKENEFQRTKVEYYYSNTAKQMATHRQEGAFSVPSSDEIDDTTYVEEIRNKANQSYQKTGITMFGRIPTVPECVQETDQSFVDTLNRTSELSMMSPTNVENNGIISFSSPKNLLIKLQAKHSNPGFVLNTRNLNCAEDSFGVSPSHLSSQGSTKASHYFDSDRKNQQYVRRYSSAIDCSKKENNLGSI